MVTNLNKAIEVEKFFRNLDLMTIWQMILLIL